MEALPEIPGYQLQYRLGEGGMAKVYFGVQIRLKRRVAVKVMESFLLKDENFSRRFLKEAETAANLNHPHIVTIYDVGQAGESYFMVMEFLDGTLKERIRRAHEKSGRGLEPQEAVRVLDAMARALEYAHHQGYIHRDIKPDNIMFRDRETPVLVDFGIAKAIGTSTKLTKTGMSIGTPHYMSPEQIRGQEVDGRADLYSLGVLFYEMLTGDVPYKATDYIAVVMKHLNDPVPALPPDLKRFQPLLERMMAKDKEKRFQSGAELLKALQVTASGGTSGEPAAVEPTLIAPVMESGGAAIDSGVRKRVSEKSSPRRKILPAAVVLLALITTALLVVWHPWKENVEPALPLSTADVARNRDDSPAEVNREAADSGAEAEEASEGDISPVGTIPDPDATPGADAPALENDPAAIPAVEKTHRAETKEETEPAATQTDKATSPQNQPAAAKKPAAQAVVKEVEKSAKPSETVVDPTPGPPQKAEPRQEPPDSSPPAAISMPETVKIIQLATEQARGYSLRMDRIVVNQLPARIRKIMGTMTLELAVGADGRIRVVKSVDARVVVIPQLGATLVKRLILEKINSIQLDPPRDKNGRSVRVEDWRLSYGVGNYEGRIILKRRL